MTINLRIVRKTVIGVFLLMALTAELAIFTTPASAQDYETGMASAPYSRRDRECNEFWNVRHAGSAD